MALQYGYMGKVLRVDLSKERVSIEPTNEQWAKEFIGGKGLGARYFYEEQRPKLDPFDPDTVLSFWTGPVTGTNAPVFGRHVVITKSPATGTFLDSYSGGFWGTEFKFAGFDGLVVTGKAKKPSYLWVHDGRAEIRDAAHLWGKPIDVVEETIRKDEGDPRVRTCAIGPAGENLSRIALITNELYRHAGRGGAGAVMGSKNLKAISVRGNKSVQVPDIEKFLALMREIQKKDVIENPDNAAMISDGTPILVDPSNDTGILPTRNFQSGTFDGAKRINTEFLKQNVLVRRMACFGCAIACSSFTRGKSERFKGVSVEGPEYETLAMCGSNCGIDDIEAVIQFNRDCDFLGLDTISAGNAVAFGMELYERGILTKKDTDGLDLRFGNIDAYVEMPALLAHRKGIGAILADGTKRAAEKVGKGTDLYTCEVKGLEYPAYDPRGSIGMALAYATSDRGACHLRAWPVAQEAYGTLDPFTPEGKAAICVEDQRRTSVKWSLVACDFYAILYPNMAALYSASTGVPADVAHMQRIGDRIWNLTRLINVREGFSRKQDTLPRRMSEVPLKGGKTDGRKIDPKDFEKMLSEYYTLWGWDASGIPTKAKLEELGLGALAPNGHPPKRRRKAG